MNSNRNIDQVLTPQEAKGTALTEMVEELKRLRASEKVLIEMSSRLKKLAVRVSQDANVPELKSKVEEPSPNKKGYLEIIRELNDSINQEIDESMHTLDVLERFI